MAIDDVAWLDDASIDVLAGIPRIAPRGRILAAVACRDDEPIPDGAARLLDGLRRDGALDLRLEPLAERDIEPLLLGHLGGEAVSPELVALLYRQCRGNPLFCLEIARAARALGAIRLERDRWTIVAGETSRTSRPKAFASPWPRGSGLCRRPRWRSSGSPRSWVPRSRTRRSQLRFPVRRVP